MTTRAALEFDEPAARDLASALVDAARRAGATWCDAAVSFGSGLSASARAGALEEVTRDTWRAAGVRVVVDGRLGLASAADAPMHKDAIDAIAAEAVALARVSSPRPENAAPDAAVDETRLAELATRLGLWDEDTAATGAEWASTRALALDRALMGHEGVSSTKIASAGARRGVFALASSWGFVGSTRSTSASCAVSGVIEEAQGKKQVDGDWDSRRARATLRDVDDIAAQAARRVLERRGARKVGSEIVPAIFAPEVARGFLGAVLACLCGDAVVRGRSFLKDARGTQVWARGARVVDDPLVPGGAASRAFDGEGTLSARHEIIDADGVLRSLLLDHRSARELNERTTGHAARGARGLPSPSPSNVLVEGGAGDLESIVRDTKRGLLVTRAMGRALDPITGEVSRGVAGFFIVDGERAFPVEEITIAGSALEMMRGIDRVGADMDTRGAIRAPTLRIGAMQLAGR